MTQQEVLESYEITKSMKETAKKLKISAKSVKKILVSNGIYPGERAGQIAYLLQEGVPVPEIAKRLKISEKTVASNMPYTKGSYKIGQKTENAIKIASHRERKKLGLPPLSGKSIPSTKHPDSPMANARLAKGLTQKQLAEKLGCSTRTIYRWETGSGRPSAQALKKIARALGCQTEDLIAPISDDRKQIKLSDAYCQFLKSEREILAKRILQIDEMLKK